MSEYTREIQTAIQAVSRAASLTSQVQKTLHSGDTIQKDDRSPVTVADFGSQTLINHDLKESFPDDPVIGEEESGPLHENPLVQEKVLNIVKPYIGPINTTGLFALIDHGRNQTNTDRYWTLDPIDGTKGFLRGDQYAIALALIENGRVVLGVMACPNYPSSMDGSIYHAVAGQGAFRRALHNDHVQSLSIETSVNPEEARFCESVEKDHASRDTHAEIAARLGVTRQPCRIDSQCKYSVVASGHAEAYLRLHYKSSYREKIWDHAAGTIILTEAGGRGTDLDDKILDFSEGRRLTTKGGIVASNGYLHKAILSAANEVMN